MTTRTRLPNRRRSVTTKLRVGHHQRTVYLTTDTGNPPRELFIRIAGQDCTSEIVGLFDCLARLVSVALQYGAPPEIVSKMLIGSKFEPSGIVVGHPSLHFCSSLPDLVAQHLLSLDPSTSLLKK